MLLALLFFFSACSFAESEFSLKTHYALEAEPLTTEKIWSLDPKLINPHLQKWALKKEVKLIGLTAQENKKDKDKGTFGVRLEAVESTTSIYLRGDGPWYQNSSELDCTKLRALEGAKYWDELLKLKRLKLNWFLQRVSGVTGDLALLKARLLFVTWLEELEAEWHKKSWKYNLNQVSNCKKGVKKIFLDSLMEPPSKDAPLLLARAPARRWGGRYSVRLSLEVAGKILVGQFLIDSGTPESILSPLWLEAQGVVPSLVQVKGEYPQKIIWTGGVGVASPGVVMGARLSGLPLPLKNFYILDTELFGPPLFVSSCCDGVLGADFLKRYAVELNPGPPVEVKVWERRGFYPGEDFFWVETSESLNKDWSSDCKLEGSQTLLGVRFDTGRQETVLLHSQYRKKLSKQGPWKLSCYSKVIVPLIPNASQNIEPLDGAQELDFTDQKNPAATIGMGVLGSAPLFFDFAHGRIWFSKSLLSTPLLFNQSGLKLSFRLNAEKDRELFIKEVFSGSLPSSLPRTSPNFLPNPKAKKLKLLEGTVITEVDSRPSVDLDAWEVEQRLSGVYGSQVILKLKLPSKDKLVKLQVR